MPERPIWAFAANDCNVGKWGNGSGPDLRWWTVPLSAEEFNPADQQASREALFDALEAGRFYISMRDTYDGDKPANAPVPPQINSFEIVDGVVDLDVWWPDTKGTIEWYSSGSVVETGETIELTDSLTPYVRAHAYTDDTIGSGNADGHLATQPITVVPSDYEPPNDPKNF